MAVPCVFWGRGAGGPAADEPAAVVIVKRDYVCVVGGNGRAALQNRVAGRGHPKMRGERDGRRAWMVGRERRPGDLTKPQPQVNPDSRGAGDVRAAPTENKDGSVRGQSCAVRGRASGTGSDADGKLWYDIQRRCERRPHREGCTSVVAGWDEARRVPTLLAPAAGVAGLG